MIATLCVVFPNALALAETPYPGSGDHDSVRRPRVAVPVTPPPVSRVPMVASPSPPASPTRKSFPQGLSSPETSDQPPFAGAPDTGEAPSPVDSPISGAAKPPARAAGTAPAIAPQSPSAGLPPSPPAGAQPTPLPPLQLVEIFSVEQNPGQGALIYSHGPQIERIDFGADAGRFGVGMFFKGEFLPDQLGREFKRKNVIQIALGTLRSRLQGQTPQFGALTVIADGMLDFRTRYLLKLPSGAASKPETGALMLFTSPSSPVEQSDEEKLKTTYFSQAGSITLTPEGKPRILDVRAQGKRLTFRQQLVAMEINTKLVTPFNAQEASLTGAIEFPIYWSEDRGGDLIAKQIARESFGMVGSIQVMDEPSNPKRTPASHKKKKKKRDVVPRQEREPGM